MAIRSTDRHDNSRVRQDRIPRRPLTTERDGSTLLIVIALLGLMTFMGLVFYSFAAQEYRSAEYYLESAKQVQEEPDNVFDFALEQMIVGPNNNYRNSILWSPTRRHSIVRNMVGSDVHPYTGEGVPIGTDGGPGRPVVLIDEDHNGVPDNARQDLLEMVDSPVVRNGAEQRASTVTSLVPEPDVDYTTPDINTMFVAYKGFAIRDNGVAAVPRYEQVPVIVPSYFRPQYMKTGPGNGATGQNVPTDADWSDPANAAFAQRSFRPHPSHVHLLSDGSTYSRYLAPGEAAGLGIVSGDFPFVPDDDLNDPGATANVGELGIWTGSDPDVYELDFDCDGDGIREAVYIDLAHPVLETASGDLYTYLYAATVYELDGLINIGTSGNLAGMPRSGNLNAITSSGTFSGTMTSRSHQGLGPNEINPVWAMQRSLIDLIPGHPAYDQFLFHYGRVPGNRLEQANMELVWLLTGRGDLSAPGMVDDLFVGRWGEAERLYNSLSTRQVGDLPRPGRPGNAQAPIAPGISFGGRDGFDDNQDRYEGEPINGYRPFGQPLDHGGKGRVTTADTTAYNGATEQFAFAGDPRVPQLKSDPASPMSAARWLQYDGYSYSNSITPLPPRYVFGPDETPGTADDLLTNGYADALFEDPLETIFDEERADRDNDSIPGPENVLALQLDSSLMTNPVEDINKRLQELAPYVFADSSPIRDRFTTISSALRYTPIHHDYGADLMSGTADDGPRVWEFNADADGADRTNDGFPDGDGRPDFPPIFGGVTAYSAADPFRPQVRRALHTEIGELRVLAGQLPISVNHLIDVDRTDQTPLEGTRNFLAFMQRSGLGLRPLTPHPKSTDTGVLTETNIPTVVVGSPLPAYPPQTVAQQEFWARRDRQQLARDIYVLLYTLGGARPENSNPSGLRRVRNYTGDNDYLDTLTPGNADDLLYSAEELRRMAQFAVNLVDAMDRDGVRTKFEYDKNLGDGWNLDDDPFTEATPISAADLNFPEETNAGQYREDGGGRGVVFGVELQQIAFSEALGIRSEVTTMDHPATLYDDTIGTRDRLFIELQNLTPTEVSLATVESTSPATGIFRLARFDRTGEDDPLADPAMPVEAVIFQRDVGIVPAGGVFTIGTSDGNDQISGQHRPADFFVDYDFDNNFDLIVPDVTAATLPTTSTLPTDPILAPKCDLDLVHASHQTSRFAFEGGGTQEGRFIQNLEDYEGNAVFEFQEPDTTRFDEDTAHPKGFDLVLQERMNPEMPSLPVTQNPWVEIDRIRVQFRSFNIQDGDAQAELTDASTGRLRRLRSSERAEPLADGTRQIHPAPNPAPVDFRYHTMGSPRNSNSPVAGFDVWQPHFDRDFASIGELLSLPLFSPHLLTQRLEDTRLSPYQQAEQVGWGPRVPDYSPSMTASAAGMFLMADFPDNLLRGGGPPGGWPPGNGRPPVGPPGPPPAVSEELARDNRWYRLLQFVEVPSRVNRMVDNYLNLTRVPGKLNLNTIRSLEVYAGLLDNAMLAQPDLAPLAGPFLTDSTPGLPGPRDRWFEFLLERDVVGTSWDPAAGGGSGASRSFVLPGMPGSRPFRSLGHRNRVARNILTENGQDDTILRRLLADLTDTGANRQETNRNWLEIGHADLHRDPIGLLPTSNPLIRHQLLSKIAGNTTTVSNTYIVYLAAVPFECWEDPATGAVRVGGKYDLDADGDNANDFQRAVFVIDRTHAFNAFDAGTGDFDWQRLVRHGVRID